MGDLSEIRRFGLERELKRNEKRIEECKVESEILRNRNRDIKEQLGIKDPPRLSNRERSRRRREQNEARQSQ
jgi:hypothetical protein